MLSRRSSALTIEEFREILSLPNHLIAIINPDGSFYKVNEEATPLLGWDPQDVIGKKVRDYVHPEDWDQTYAHMASVFLGREAVVEDMRNRIKRKDGSWRWVSWTGKARGGRIYAHGSDITDKVEYEEALTVQALVLESISEGVVICNGKGEMVFANTAAEKLFGYGAEELLGKNVILLSAISEEESLAKIAEMLKAIETDQVWMGEFENLRKDGTRITTSCRVTVLDLHGEDHFVCVQRDITRKKAYEKERQELASRFRAFFEQSALPMIIFDINGHALEANSAWELLVGASKKNLEGFNIFTDSSSEKFGLLPYLNRAREGEAVMVPPFYNDPSLLDGGRPGRARWIEAWFSPIKNPDGTVREIAMILKDVTDQKAAQQGLQEMEARYRVASESLSLAVRVGKVGVWEWLPQENIVIWDETTETIYGYPKGTFPKTFEAYQSHLHPEDRSRCREVVNESIHDAHAYTIDYRIYRKDGSIRWLQGSGMPFYNQNGEVIRVLGTTIDITERKEHEEDQKFLADIAEILSSSFDYERNIQRVLDLAVNKDFDGATVDEITGPLRSRRIAAANNREDLRDTMIDIHRDHYEILDRRHPFLSSLQGEKEVIIEDMDKLLEKGGFHDEYLMRARSLEMKSGIVITLMGKNGPLGTLALHLRKDNPAPLTPRLRKIANEIAFRMSLAIENSLLYHHSQDAIRARDEFLSIASHELKTPLQSLTLQNQMRRRLLERGNQEAMEPNAILRAIDMDKRQLSRINRLIDDMLDISRIRNAKLSIQKEKFSIVTLLDDICDRIGPQLESAGCKLNKEYKENCEVVADSYRIEQVIMNILINAMKYGAGAPVTVRTKITDKKAIIEIEDNGPGIREADRERIFRRFERAVSSHEVSGLGLGLYISRQIMELHRGTVYVTNTPGTGATFVVEIPL